MASYRDIMRGAELKAEYDKFVAWQSKSRAEKQNLYEALNVNKFTYNKETYYVAPFGQGAKTIYVAIEQAASGTPSPGNEALDLSSAYSTKTAPIGTGDTILDPTTFAKNKLAKLIVKRRVTAATEKSPSRITGRKYRRHATNAVSVFLGKATATDDFSDVVKAIRGTAKYKDYVAVVGNSIAFVPEG